jgi:ABC-type polysaccharide/polyol phosphate transport system ATPase subunit
MEPAVEFIEVSKKFSLSNGPMLLRNRLMGLFKGYRKETFYALKDVSFRLDRGESLAVIGPNGAGKSTLLSLVARLAPTDHGTVRVNGRLAALLELGSGFHPDLTGVENVYVNAALLGLSRREAKRCFDAITEFAEIGDFIRQPLRTYSTGMIMRLAFSVAVNVDPEILLIDEVLAVGDQSFQAKCLDKIHEFRRRGKSLLCVSHSASMIAQLCDQALWLDHGELIQQGPIEEVQAAYSRGLPPHSKEVPDELLKG